MIVRMSAVTSRALAGLLCLASMVTACSSPPAPISLDDGTVVVLNQTKAEWRNA